MFRPAPPHRDNNVTMSCDIPHNKQLPTTPNNNQQSPLKPQKSYTVRVIFCVLFVFLTEIFLAHYVYRLINSEMRSDYVAKQDFLQYFLNEVRSENGREQILRIIRESSATSRKKRSPANYNLLNSGDEEISSHVEFFSPNERSAMEKKGALPAGDSWVYLTSYCRVTKKAVEGYCKEIQLYCPQMKSPGPKGDRGDKGLPGIPGPIGPRGLPGIPGENGIDGKPGTPGRLGLDGRDGIPGEPGLDGMPGRNGYDGIPGEPGRDGKDGMPGIPGRDGSKGEMGLQGPPGPPGVRGLTGPKGKAGRNGRDGSPGIPGIKAYELNGKNATQLLIPPSISGPPSSVTVTEGDNVRLHCSATGNPHPQITWMRFGSSPISRGIWQDTKLTSPTLNITHVNRIHMGQYKCIANNGIPPEATQIINLEVQFGPLVRVPNNVIEVATGSTAVLECETEAFPQSVRYWERSDGRILENSHKYQIVNENEDKVFYRAKMYLNITRIQPSDYAFKYFCVSKNDRGLYKGELQVQEPQPGRSKQPVGGPNVVGMLPPKLDSQEEICEDFCPKCIDTTSCDHSGVSLINLISRWEIRKFDYGRFDAPLPPRTTNCVLYAVGKPVYHGSMEDGCWMRDLNPFLGDKDVDRFWVTKENDPRHLFLYENKDFFKKNIATKVYKLNRPFEGNAHVIYNNSFYYHENKTNNLVKFSLETENSTWKAMPDGINWTRLYSGRHNYMDFSADDNGLWAIFPVPKSNNTAIMKFDANTMKINYIWNVSIEHQKVGEMFIVCGVLYAVDSVTDRNTKIRFALDLYNEKLVDVDLTFSNPFKKTTMIGYHHKNRELYTWDKGNQLTYPVRYNELGNGTQEEKIN